MDPPYPGPDRRSRGRRGVLRRLLDLDYRTLRWIGGHVRGFYAAVGLFLVLGLGLSLLALLGFAAIAEGVAAGTTQRMDEAVLRWLNARTAGWLDALALTGTALGSGVALWIVLLGGTVFLWRSRHHYSVLLLWVSLLGGRTLNQVLKAAYDRPRPQLFGPEIQALGFRFDYPSSTSFPSGHATTAVVIFGTLAYLVARLEPTRRQRRITLVGTGLVILVIGFSRVYLGVHYPSDVVAGYIAGFVWATSCALGIEAVRYFRWRKPGVAAEERDLEKGIAPLDEAISGDGRA